MSTDQFPASGLSEDLLFQDMEAARKSDVDWRAGRLPGFYVHFASDEVDEIGRKALEMFHATNALGMAAFPSIRKFEAELVGWALDLFNAEDGCGSVTSGGTESIFLAVKTAREWARRHRPDVTAPKMVMPHSAHPAFDKAAKYLCMEPVRVPLQDDLRADVAAIKAEIDERTVFMMGSAPQFTFGLFDQIDELAAIADERNIWFHTDACVGGFLSPFAESLGYDIPPWDFRVRGVKSISADLHKYGFAPKGASIVAFADDEASVRPFQVFDFENWSRGRYATPTFAGTRPGATIAAAWAVMRFLGREGYTKIAAEIMRAKSKLREGIKAIPGLDICGDPPLSVMSYTSTELDMQAIAAGMSTKGWYTVAPSPNPPAINLGLLSLAFAAVADQYLADLRNVCEQVRAGRADYDAAKIGGYGAQ